jgi:hypothetical protein
VPQDSQMQFDVGFGSSSILLLLGTPSILIVYKISGKILTPPVSPISSQSLIYLSLLPYHLKVVDHSKERHVKTMYLVWNVKSRGLDQCWACIWF